MHPEPSADEPHSPLVLRPHVTASALGRVWRWLTVVHSDDPIRQALNRGFAHIIVAFNFFSLIFIFVAFAAGDIAAGLVTTLAVPMGVFIWWLNRRGTIYGAAIYVVWLIAVFVLVSPPATYAGADTPIPLLLVFPIITATLFIRPQAGFWTLMLMMVVLAVQLYSSDVPRPYIERFFIVGTLDLAAMTVFLAVGASIFWRTLRASTATNEALRRQQDLFSYAALATQDALYDWDLRTHTVVRNEAYRKFYTSDDPQAELQSWWETHVHPDDFGRVKASLQAAFSSHSDFWSDEYRLRRADGPYANVLDNAYILYDAARQPMRMIGAITDVTERKQMEEERRVSEARFRAFVDHATDALFFHEWGTILDANLQACVSLGYSREELIGMTPYDFDVNLDQAVMDQIEARLNAGGVFTFETQHRRKDGTIFPVEVRVRGFVQGESHFAVSVARDITERKQNEVRMRALIDAIPDMIVRHDREGRYLEIKASSSIPLNYAVPDAIGHTVWEMLPHDPKLAEDIVHTIEKVLDTGEMIVQEYPLIYDGKTIYRERRTVPADSDEVMMLIRDITARKQAEAERRVSEARFRAFVDHATDALFFHAWGTILDVNGTILDVNSQACVSLGYSREELIGMTPYDFDVNFEQAVMDQIEARLKTGEVFTFETQHRRKDGTIFPVEVRVRGFVQDESHFAVSVARDITERKQTEAERLELALARERVELLKEFVDTVSHDLKTPLTVINTSLYLLERATDPAVQQVKVKLIKEQVQRLGKMIQDLLTLSRLDTLPDFAASALDINQLLLEVQAQLKAVAEDRQITLETNLAATLPLVWGSEDDLQRAFTNLVENALHYTLADGTVTVRTFEQANQVTVEVSDTGIGIDEADLSHIFEHFYRSDEARTVDTHGTGLGLAIVAKIVKKHQGSIKVESQLGQGTTFRVTLPAADKTT